VSLLCSAAVIVNPDQKPLEPSVFLHFLLPYRPVPQTEPLKPSADTAESVATAAKLGGCAHMGQPLATYRMNLGSVDHRTLVNMVVWTPDSSLLMGRSRRNRATVHIAYLEALREVFLPASQSCEVGKGDLGYHRPSYTCHAPLKACPHMEMCLHRVESKAEYCGMTSTVSHGVQSSVMH